MRCVQARAQDWPALLAALQAAPPTSDYNPAFARDHLEHFILAWRGNQLIGYAGAEVFGSLALLHGVGIVQALPAPEAKTAVIDALIDTLMDHCRQRQVCRLYLVPSDPTTPPRFRGAQQLDFESLPVLLWQSEVLMTSQHLPDTAWMLALGERNPDEVAEML